MTLPPFIIDCDTGRDDALAIWICAAQGLPLAGIVSSYGNTVLENVVENNRRVLALAQSSGDLADTALYAGEQKPSRDHKAYRDIVLPRQETAGNGLCNITLPEAPQDLQPALLPALAEKIDSMPSCDYIITGPATNFAALLESTPALKEKIGTVTMMGGKFDPLWQDLPGADFNIACDPFAVQAILEHGIAMRFVPMNATWPIVLPLEDIERLEPHTPLAQASKDIMIAHCRHFVPEPVFRFHDPSVIMACLHPDSFVTETIRIELEEANPYFGRLIPDEKGGPVSIFCPSGETRTFFLTQMLEILGLGKAA